MAAGDSVTAVDDVSAGTTTIQPSSGDVWSITSIAANTNTSLDAYDGTNAKSLEQGSNLNVRHFADNSEYLQWNNTGCSSETNAYGGQKVVE